MKSLGRWLRTILNDVKTQMCALQMLCFEFDLWAVLTFYFWNCQECWISTSTIEFEFEDWTLLPAGHKLVKPNYFSKIEDEEIQKQIDKLEQPKRLTKPRINVNHKRADSVWGFCQNGYPYRNDLRSRKMPKPTNFSFWKLILELMFTIVSGIAESLNRRISLGNELPFSELGTKKLTRRRKSRHDFNDYKCWRKTSVL
jgi:hypothetical protein